MVVLRHLLVCVFVFFFCKQKTAYEMRISDWSSDVCSSDLRPEPPAIGCTSRLSSSSSPSRISQLTRVPLPDMAMSLPGSALSRRSDEIGRASCRERVCQYV